MRASTARDDAESGTPISHGVADGPLAGALLAGLVEDEIDDRLAGLRILLARRCLPVIWMR